MVLYPIGQFHQLKGGRMATEDEVLFAIVELAMSRRAPPPSEATIATRAAEDARALTDLAVVGTLQESVTPAAPVHFGTPAQLH